jgi:hypothetical protein
MGAGIAEAFAESGFHNDKVILRKHRNMNDENLYYFRETSEKG